MRKRTAPPQLPFMDNLLVHIGDAGTRLCLGRCPLGATIEDGEPREAKVYLPGQALGKK